MRIDTVPPDPAILRTLAGIDGDTYRGFISKHLGKHLHYIIQREMGALVSREITLLLQIHVELQLQADGIRGRRVDDR